MKAGARKILFLTLYPEGAASSRYRVTQFFPYLRDQGMDCAFASAVTESQWKSLAGPNRTGRPFWYHAKETPRRIAQVLGAGSFDVVFLQKAIMTAYLIGVDRLLYARARALVYDIDDAVHLAPPHPLRGLWKILEDRNQVRRIMRRASLVLAGNAWLADESRANARDAHLFPTVVDTDRFVPAANIPTAFCVGWIGGPSTTPHLAVAAEGLSALPDATIRLIGADPARAPIATAEIRPWSLEGEVSEIQRFSVGIMPLPKDDWSRGKCALKALLYMACGVPCISTPFGAVLDIISHGENGLFADSPEEWRDAVDRLRDPAERGRMGELARATVESRFSLRQAAPRLYRLLESAP